PGADDGRARRSSRHARPPRRGHAARQQLARAERSLALELAAQREGDVRRFLARVVAHFFTFRLAPAAARGFWPAADDASFRFACFPESPRTSSTRSRIRSATSRLLASGSSTTERASTSVTVFVSPPRPSSGVFSTIRSAFLIASFLRAFSTPCSVSSAKPTTS